MERAETRDDDGHVIDITRISEPPFNRSNLQQIENPPSTSVSDSVLQHSSSTTNGTNQTNDRRRSPVPNPRYGIAFDFVITMSQIIAAIVVLSMSKHEHPRALLFAWVIAYASGRFATLPLLVWRFYHDTETSDQDPSSNARLEVVEYFKTGMDCFFLVWVIVGDFWIVDGHPSDVPNLHWLCIAFIYYTYFTNIMPFVIYATIRWCLPCTFSVLEPWLGPSQNRGPTQNRGATSESINSLPTFKFKTKKHKHGSNRGTHESTIEGGVVAAGTENERVLTGEDAVCCICLAKYANNDELRQLMCSHFFHKKCVDKWLKINALCPLCKSEVGKRALRSLTETTGAGMQL